MKTKILTPIILIFTLIISTLANAEAPVLTIDSVEGNQGILTINYTVIESKGEKFVTAGWQFSTDGGVTWLDIDAIAIGNNTPKPAGGSFITWDTQVGVNNLAFKYYGKYHGSVSFRMFVKGLGIWKTKSPMPTGIFAPVGVEVNGKVYAMGEKYANRDLAIVEEYAPSTDSWRTVTPMPTPRYDFAAVAVDGKIYAIGGDEDAEATSTVEEYNPITDSWRVVAPMPTARHSLAAAVVDGKIYAIGGTKDIFGLQRGKTTVEEYNPSTDSWRTVAPIPTARHSFAVAALDGKIYAIGGWTDWKPLSIVEEYDPQTDSWRTVESMPTARGNMAAALVERKIYVMGSRTGRFSWEVTATVEEYDLSTDSWRTASPMPTADWFGFSAATVDGRIYALSSNRLDEYSPPRESEPAASDSFAVANQIKAIIASPADGALLYGVVNVRGIAGVTEGSLNSWTLDFARGEYPTSGYMPITASSTPVEDDLLGVWDTTAQDDGVYTLRLRVTDTDGVTVETSVVVTLDNITPRTDYYVDAKRGNNAKGDGSPNKPWKTISYALLKVSGKGIIHVAEGTYDPELGEVFPLYMKDGLSLVGAGANTTILDAEYRAHAVISARNITDKNTRIQGFTIMRAKSRDKVGGIYIEHSSLIVLNNLITKNKATAWGGGDEYGGAINVRYSDVVIQDNEIRGNHSTGIVFVGCESSQVRNNGIKDNVYDKGIGILLLNSSPLIENNLFWRNRLPIDTVYYGTGGAITSFDGSRPKILNNRMIRNSASGAGAIYAWGSAPVIEGNVIADNYAFEDYGAIRVSGNIQEISETGSIQEISTRIVNNTIVGHYSSGILCRENSKAVVINNIIAYNEGHAIKEDETNSVPETVAYNLLYENTAGAYLNDRGQTYLNVRTMDELLPQSHDNIDGDPKFVNRDIWDFRLKPDSPSIDAGYPDFPLDPNGTRSDIGALYYRPVIPPDEPPPDATEWYVDWKAKEGGNGTQSNPWKTITDALSLIKRKGIIHVAEGRYDRILGEDFPLKMIDGVSLVGVGANKTVLDAQYTNSVIEGIGISDETTRIEGFTIKNGFNPTGGGGIVIAAGSTLSITNNIIVDNNVPVDYFSTSPKSEDGGGIYIRDSSPTISNNRIMWNWVGAVGLFSTGSGGYGGGIAIVGDSSPIIEHNIISENKAITTSFADALGGGIYVSGGAPIIRDNVISMNSVRQRSATSGSTRGGGIYITGSSSATISRNLISENTSSKEYGSVKECSGIYIVDASPKINNNIITGNRFGGIVLVNGAPDIVNNTISANDKSGILVGSDSSPSIVNNILANNTGYGIYEASPDDEPSSVRYNLFYGNVDGSYYDEGSQAYQTVVELDSSVAECADNVEGEPLFVDPKGGDYHIRAGSPAINAGDPDPSYNDADGTRNDIGAYGGPSISQPPSWDVNGDGVADILDLVLVGKHFGEHPPTDARADVNGDGTIDIADIVLVAKHFGEKTDSGPAASPPSFVASNPAKIWLVSERRKSNAPSQLLRVSVMADATADLYGFQFDLAFPQGMLEVVSISEGNLLKQGTGSTYWHAPQIDKQAGRITDAAAIRVATNRGISEGGVLATISFKVNDAGLTLRGNIDLENVKLVNSKGKLIPVLQETFPLENLIIPQRTELCQNYPNPFNPETWIPYKLSESSKVTIRIYNVRGQLIRQLELGHRDAGFYISKERAAYWDGRNDTGERVASGVYFYQLQAGEFNVTRKLVVLK